MLFSQPHVVNNGTCLKLITRANKMVHNASSLQIVTAGSTGLAVHPLPLLFLTNPLNFSACGCCKATTKKEMRWLQEDVDLWENVVPFKSEEQPTLDCLWFYPNICFSALTYFVVFLRFFHSCSLTGEYQLKT